jgi:acetoin utilization deacetylase AcuC-like enzyme
MQIVYSPAHERHAPKTFIRRGVVVPNPETPERAATLLAAVQNGGHRIVAPDDFGPAPREAVHTAEYLGFLETVHARWQAMPEAGGEVVPNVHPGRLMSHRPTGITGLVGWHTADTACPIGAGTWEAAIASANVALHAAALVLAGEQVAYALCRPPGHHAYADMAGGFCYLNNVAIAAQHMRATLPRVAILDIDVHHGNGTQGIFYERGDVFFASLHADPSDYYPFYAGYAEERGAGAGLGANLNLPLAPGSGDAEMLSALDRALAALREHAPAALLVSLGFDASEADPLGILKVTSDGFAEIARRIATLGLPTVLVQEGGYMSAILGQNLARFLTGFEAAQR